MPTRAVASAATDRLVSKQPLRLMLLEAAAFVGLYGLLAFVFSFAIPCLLAECSDRWEMYEMHRRLEFNDFVAALFGTHNPRLTAAIWALAAASAFWFLGFLGTTGRYRFREWYVNRPGGPLVALAWLVPLAFAFGYLASFHWMDGLAKYGFHEGNLFITLFPYWFGFWFAYFVANDSPPAPDANESGDFNGRAAFVGLVLTVAFYAVKP